MAKLVNTASRDVSLRSTVKKKLSRYARLYCTVVNYEINLGLGRMCVCKEDIYRERENVLETRSYV